MDISINLEFLAGLIGHSPEELSEAIKKENTDELKSPKEIESIVSAALQTKFKTTRKAGYDEGHGRGKSESLTKLEKELAQEWDVPYEDGKTVKDLAQAWHEKQSKPGSGKLTPESVKAHEIYVNDMKAEIQKRTTLQAEFEQFKAGIERQQTTAAIQKNAMSILKENNFALPEDETIQANQISGFISALTKDKNFVLEGDDVKSILDANKNPVKDNLMNDVSFKDLVLQTGKGWFTVKQSDGRESPGVTTKPGGTPPANFTIPVVKSSEAYFQEFGKLQSLEQKQAFAKHYEKQLKDGF